MKLLVTDFNIDLPVTDIGPGQVRSCCTRTNQMPTVTVLQLVNKCGVRIYAKVGRDWESDVGCGRPNQGCADTYWKMADGDIESGTCRLVNAASHRSLYAQRGKDKTNGLGASQLEHPKYADSYWCLEGPRQGPFEIINNHSGRRLFAGGQGDRREWVPLNAVSPNFKPGDPAGQWYLHPVETSKSKQVISYRNQSTCLLAVASTARLITEF